MRSSLRNLMRPVKHLLPVFWLAAVVTTASAAPSALIVRDEPLPVTDLSPYVSVFVDPTAGMDIEQVMAADFAATMQDPPSFGITRHAVWVRFTVRSAADRRQDLIAELLWARLSHLTWYVVADGRVVKSAVGGAADEPRRTDRMPTIGFELPPGAEWTVYLRGESDTSILLPLRIGSAELMRRFEQRQTTADALQIGFCLALAFLALLVGWVQRSRLYLYLAAIALCYALYYAIYHGYAALALAGAPLWVERQMFGMVFALLFFFLAVFNGSFIGRARMNRREQWLQRLAEGITLAGVLAFLVFDFRTAIRLAVPLPLIGILTGLVLVLARRERRPAEIWLAAALAAFVPLLLLGELQLKGVVPVLIPFWILQLLMWPSILTVFFVVAMVRQRASEAEKQQRAAERQAHELVANIEAGTYEVALEKDAQGVVGPQFQFASPQFLEMFGLEREALLADPSVITSRIHAEDAERLNAANAEAYKTGGAFRWEGRVMVGDRARWFVAVATPRKKPDGLTIWSGVVTDVTDRVEAEKKLARALEAKGQFLAKMSHEIRTPLSALVSLAQAMWMRGEEQELDPKFTQFLNRVRSGGQYLNLLLRNVLSVSAAESGRVPVKVSEFYVNDWAGEIRNILEPIAEYHRGRIEWTMPADDEARFRTDQLRLTQIALNLGENALKFSAGQDQPVRIAVDKVDDRLRLVVEDHGPGIPPEMTKAVFEEFSQTGTEVSPLDEGVGLGLAVVRINAELLGGTVRVQPLEPHGTRFLVEVPEMVQGA